MTVTECALLFECAGESLPGVVSIPKTSASTGVLIVVGGPQYRVGSHRQFVLLARFLAEHGVPCMRFDYRGMGDATGEARDFEAVDRDVDGAIAAFVAAVPGMQQVVLWGLCDGASAIGLGLGANPNVVGAVLLNPWVHTAAGAARTMLRHYYLRRLFDKRFWVKLLRGGVNVRAALGGVKASADKVLTVNPDDGPPSAANAASLPARMLRSLAPCSIPVAIFLSGRDHVAREFELLSANDDGWRRLLDSPRFCTRHFESADHTFSSAAARQSVAEATLAWLRAHRFAEGVRQS